jgi:hypothetical protein
MPPGYTLNFTISFGFTEFNKVIFIVDAVKLYVEIDLKTLLLNTKT